jgi:hypothetical protein
MVTQRSSSGSACCSHCWQQQKQQEGLQAGSLMCMQPAVQHCHQMQSQTLMMTMNRSYTLAGQQQHQQQELRHNYNI